MVKYGMIQETYLLIGLSISFDGKDLTVGSYPVTSVMFKVNGDEWHNSGGISQTNYHMVVNRTVDCGYQPIDLR